MVFCPKDTFLGAFFVTSKLNNVFDHHCLVNMVFLKQATESNKSFRQYQRFYFEIFS